MRTPGNPASFLILHQNVYEDHVGILGTSLVEFTEDGSRVVDVLSAGDEGSFGRCARVSRSLCARIKSRASMEADVGGQIAWSLGGI